MWWLITDFQKLICIYRDESESDGSERPVWAQHEDILMSSHKLYCHTLHKVNEVQHLQLKLCIYFLVKITFKIEMLYNFFYVKIIKS